jgi:hypothetical protein
MAPVFPVYNRKKGLIVQNRNKLLPAYSAQKKVIHQLINNGKLVFV